MNDVDLLKIRVEALTKRLQKVERWIRPLAELEGVDAEFLGDQGIVDFIAHQMGSRLSIVAGTSRLREDSAARAHVARQLKTKLNWSDARIGRNLGRTEAGVRKLLKKGS
jgi:hypothetical protein